MSPIPPPDSSDSSALQRRDGVGIVVLFNQRTDPSELDYFRIESVMNRAADEVKHWPAPGEPGH